MKIIFFGSSEFSLYALKACLETRQEVVMVISTPPQKQGRGLKEICSPVSRFAAENSLPCLVPDNLKSPELLEKIKTLLPDLFVVSSYGKMIPSAWLKVPSLHALNVHPSLLPKYRGAAPINWPILNGDAETGISIAEVTAKLDAGDIFYQKTIPLQEHQTSETLEKYLGELSGPALEDVFKKIQNHSIQRYPQDESKMTYARKLTKEDGVLDWNRSAKDLSNQIRGLLPWPVACFRFREETVQVLKGAHDHLLERNFKPGQIISIDNKLGSIAVQASEGCLLMERVKPAGKKEMGAAEFIRGKRLAPGDFLN